MSEPPAGAAGSADAALRTTLTVGGILLLAQAAALLLTMAMAGAVGSIPLLSWIGILVSSAALVIFAIGIGRQGSLVARRPLGVAALLVLAVWPFVDRTIEAFIPITIDSVDFWQSWGYASLAVRVCAAIIAVVEIARAGVIRGSLRWAPMWALVAIAVPQVVMNLAYAAPGYQSLDLAGPIVGLSQLVSVGVPLTLGVLAVVRSRTRQSAPEAVQVYPPSTDTPEA